VLAIVLVGRCATPSNALQHYARLRASSYAIFFTLARNEKLPLSASSKAE